MSPRGQKLLKRQLLWVAVGLLAYLGAGVLLLVALVPAFSEEGLEISAVGAEQLGAMFASLLLFVIGGYAARRLRGGMARSGGQREMADVYQPGLSQQIQRDAAGDGPDEEPDTLTCSNCGAVNERFYTYCGECSEKL